MQRDHPRAGPPSSEGREPPGLRTIASTAIAALGSEPPAPAEHTGHKVLVIVVPAYNEAERIGETIAELGSVRLELEGMGVSPRIYVVDDGSQDETAARAQQAGADRLVRHRANRGLGAAVRTGLNAARSDGADIVVKFDADLQHDPRDILELIQPIIRDEAEIVFGNRFDRIEYRMPFVRRIGNTVFTTLMRWLTGWPLRDSQPGIFAADRSYLQVFHIPGDYNYTQQILLDAYHRGMRFAHVAVAFRERLTGRSFVSYRYPMKVMPQIFMVIVGVRPLRIFMPIGLAFLLVGATVFTVQVSQWALGDAPKPVQNVNLVLGSSLFGLQTMFFGILAELIVNRR